ncbi:MAG: bifunctional glutamate N-acetyltransferase/amino-acid acetyltransferase ArgJ [Burkholderiales bacterium]|nr:bifunctional glutamate N-acetyltransferase/amino-acid acetyltransferase ArgJ [Burkholderiales bacterium]
MTQLKFIQGGVCAPLGFKASGIAAGLKKSLKPDLALIYSEVSASAAGVYTKNAIKAAPLLLTKKHVKNGKLQAIITNSGNANSCTGKNGTHHAQQTAKKLAQHLKIDTNLVAVSSTGVIGVPLPIEKLLNGIPSLVESLNNESNQLMAKAILTTDTFIKESAVEITLTNGEIAKIGGVAKGSGMIHPNMATMLAYITTDINITQEILQKALTMAVNESFNMISVDGDSSTNDMALIMANGCANNSEISLLKDNNYQIFYQGLLSVCVDLAKQIAKDGEGASKLITVNVTNAKTSKDAKKIAKSIISSSLFKSAVFGNDANWGRIACATGYADAYINPNKLQISIAQLILFEKGIPLAFDEDIALRLLDKPEITINVDLGIGNKSATAWGCDLTYDYIKINASYRT